MPVYEIETPDGRIVEIEAASAGAAAIGARDYVKKNPKKADPLRGVKMGARQLAEGAGSALDIVGTPVNTTINALTGSRLNTQPGRNLASSLSDMANLPTANTRAERLAGAVNEFAGGSLGGSAVGSMLRKAPGALGAIGREFAEKPLQQAVSAGIGGAASQGVEESGGNELAQVAAALVAGAGAYKLTGADLRAMAAKKKTGAKVSNPVSRIANKATGGKMLDPRAEAMGLIRKDLKADGATPDQIKQIVAQWRATGASDPTMLDAVTKLPTGGQNTLARLRGAALNSPTARGKVMQYRNDLEANIQDNAQNLTDRLTPDTRTTQKFIDDTTSQRSRNAETLYREDYALPLSLQKQTLSALSDAPGNAALLRSRSSAVANQRWDQVSEIDNLLAAQDQNFNWSQRTPVERTNSPEGILNSMVNLPPDRLPEVPEVTGGTLDRARIQMREMARSAAREGNNDLARGLFERVRLIDDTLDNAPQIRTARADYGNFSSALEAADIGSDIIAAKPNQFDYDLAGIRSRVRPVGDNPAPVNLVDNSAALASKNAISEAIGNPTQTATGLLNRLSSSNNMGRKLGTAFGDRAEPYREGIGNEVRRLQNARAIDPNIGSQTALRQADGVQEASDLVQGVTSLTSPVGVVNAIFNVIKKVQSGATITEAEREALVDILLSKPEITIQEVQAAAQAVEAGLLPPQILSRLVVKLPASATTQSALTFNGGGLYPQAMAEEEEQGVPLQ